MTDDQDLCGEDTAEGDPCQRAAGWGTDRDDGPCRYHTEDRMEAKLESVKEDIKKVIELLEEELIPIREACQQVGISLPTIHRWLDRVDLREEYESVMEAQEEARVDAVEDALFADAYEGKATGAERIFWLKNRASERWKDSQHIHKEGEVEHTGDLSVTIREQVVESRDGDPAEDAEE